MMNSRMDVGRSSIAAAGLRWHSRLAMAAMTSALLVLPGRAGAEAVDMESMIARSAPSASQLRFLGKDLISTYREPGAPARIVRWRDGRPIKIADGDLAAPSPDGKRLAFLRGNELVVLDLVSGSTRIEPLAGSVSASRSPIWSANGRRLSFHYGLGSYVPDQIRDKRTVDGVTIEDVGRSGLLRQEAVANTFKPRLLIWDLETGDRTIHKIEELDSYPGTWVGVDYLFAVAQFTFGGRRPFTAVRRMRPDGSTIDLYRTDNFNQAVRPTLSPDGRRIAFVDDADAPTYGVCNQITTLNLTSLAARRFRVPGCVTSADWAADGSLFYLLQNAGLPQVGRVGRNGKIEAITTDLVARSSLAVSQDRETFGYITNDGYGRSEIRTVSLSPGRERRKATIYDLGQNHRLGAFKTISWRTTDGLEIKGWLFLPADFSPSRQYPLFVDIHGGGAGATLSFSNMLNFGINGAILWHAWAAYGYVVFVPDYRTSGEYGAAVAVAREVYQGWDSRFLAKDADDVASGVAHLVKQGFIDKHRMVLFGHSAGGGRAHYLLGRTRMFAAAIIHEPVGDGGDLDALEAAATFGRGAPLAMLQTSGSDEERHRRLQGYSFEDYRIKTPTLLMTGEESRGGVYPLSTELLFSILQATGTPAKYIHFPEDGHVPASRASALLRFKLTKQWMDQYAPAGRFTPASSAVPPDSPQPM